MATYNSDVYNNSVPLPGHVGDGGRNVTLYSQPIRITTAITSSDSGTVFTPPKGFTVLYTIIKASDLDTASSPSLTLNVGISGTAAKFVSASTVGQAGTAAQSIIAGGCGYQFDGSTAVVWARAAGPGTGATGTIEIWMVGYYAATAL